MQACWPHHALADGGEHHRSGPLVRARYLDYINRPSALDPLEEAKIKHVRRAIEVRRAVTPACGRDSIESCVPLTGSTAVSGPPRAQTADSLTRLGIERGFQVIR